MNIIRALLLIIGMSSGLALAAQGMITLESPYPAKETMDRLESIAKQKGMTIFARIDHAAQAEQVGMSMRPTEVLIFGNPRGGTFFMQCGQTLGIDLPMKALVWQDEAGKVFLGYNDPAYLTQRHEISQCFAAGRIKQAFGSLMEAAVAKE